MVRGMGIGPVVDVQGENSVVRVHGALSCLHESVEVDGSGGREGGHCGFKW